MPNAVCLDLGLGRSTVGLGCFVLKANASRRLVDVEGKAEPHYRSFMGPYFV